jgi:RNA polymerase sigma factor (sigma-70 family)
MKTIRLEARLRNNILWHCIFDNWKSVKSFCDERNYNPSCVGNLLNLKSSPLKKTKDRKEYYGTREKDYKELCQKLAKEFGILVEDLFPIDIYELPFTVKSIEIEKRIIPLRTVKEISAPIDLIDTIEEIQKREAIIEILETLPPREKDVIKKRFGIDGPEQSLKEIAKDWGCTKERIRQLESKALRRLRKPTKANKKFKKICGYDDE